MLAYLVSLAIAMLAGLLMTRLLRYLKLPEVTSYLIAGVLVGPFVLGLIPPINYGGSHIWFGLSKEMVGSNGLKLITSVALGFIAFSIGNEFRLSELKKIGKPALVIGILQAVVTTVLVDIVLVVVHFILPNQLNLSSAIVLGAIASATAPAATLMVVKQYNAKGELTSLLLPIVALDDAVGLVIFAVSNGIGQALETGTLSMITILANPVIEIVLSLGTGAVLGVVFAYITKLFKSRHNNVMLAITFVVIAVAIASVEHTFANGAKIGFSPLLVCMMMGTIFCNLCKTSEMTMSNTERWTPVVFLLFFVISGAELDLSVFRNGYIILIGVIYILVRCAGKYIGTFGSCALMKCSKKARNFLGITLFPQAGVALGMVAIASETMAEGSKIKSIVLFAVLVYEIVGPLLTKIALTASGDIVKQMPAKAAATDSGTVTEGTPEEVVDSLPDSATAPETQVNEESPNENNTAK